MTHPQNAGSFGDFLHELNFSLYQNLNDAVLKFKLTIFFY